jgi:hypothetical protein
MPEKRDQGERPMKKTITRGALIVVLLIAILAFSAPARAEMPVSWLSDLIAWYLDQNGVNITLLLPNSGINSDTDPNSLDPTIVVIEGENTHYLWGYHIYDQHTGTLHGAGSDIHYNFTQCPYLLWDNPFTYFAYNCGQVSNTLTYPVTGDPMFGAVAWMDGQGECGLEGGTARMRFTFDFIYNGWRYGGVVYNKVSEHGYGYTSPPTEWWKFIGTYSGAMTNIPMGPLTRYTYANRPLTVGGCVVNGHENGYD